MAKFLITGDIHLRTATPEMRTESDFEQVCLGKFEWLLNQAVQHECEAVLCPGDFFDIPNPTSRLQAQVIKLLKEYDIPVITTIGNHDVTARTTSNYEFSALSVLAATGGVIVVTGGEYVEYEDTNSTIRIYGYGYGEKVTEQLINGKTRKDPDVYSIALIHASIGSNYGEAQYAIEDLDIKGADVAVIGDIHSGWSNKFTHKSGCTCFNCGCLVRIRTTESEYVPRCVVFDTAGSWDTLIVPHLSAKECFDVKRIEKRTDDKVRAFNAAYERSKEIQMEKPDEMVRRIGLAAEFPEGIIEGVTERLP